MFKTAGSLSDIKVTFDLRDEDDIGDDDEVASVSKTYYTNLLSFVGFHQTKLVGLSIIKIKPLFLYSILCILQGSFNLGDNQEESGSKQTKCLLKWKGDDVGHVVISVHVQPVIVVN